MSPLLVRIDVRAELVVGPHEKFAGIEEALRHGLPALVQNSYSLLGRDDEARAVYLRYRGEQRVALDKSWETIILGDFAELRRAKLTHPLMDEIEELFASRH